VVPEIYDLEQIHKKCTDKQGIVRDVHLVAMAEHCREKLAIKDKITSLVNFIAMENT